MSHNILDTDLYSYSNKAKIRRWKMTGGDDFVLGYMFDLSVARLKHDIFAVVLLWNKFDLVFEVKAYGVGSKDQRIPLDYLSMLCSLSDYEKETPNIHLKLNGDFFEDKPDAPMYVRTHFERLCSNVMHGLLIPIPQLQDTWLNVLLSE